MSLPLVTCPGLFYGALAQDGILSRMRIPGGMLNSSQALAIADLIDQYGTSFVQVTNRANLQIRGLTENISPEVFDNLKKLGISPRLRQVDPIRNIMISPTAGIDPQQLLDTRPLVQEFDDYLQAHPELAALSPKFSVGFDGGELVSIRDRLNDITLVAQHLPNNTFEFRLYLNLDKNSVDTGVVISANYISVLAALIQVYLEYCLSHPLVAGRKPRLRHLLNDWGVDDYFAKVEQYLETPWDRACFQTALSDLDPPQPPEFRRENYFKVPRIQGDNGGSPSLKTSPNGTDWTAQVGQNYQHLGIHRQRQPGFSYLGIVLPLGRLASGQLRQLANLAQFYGSGTLRLTPWQNLLISDLPESKLPEIQQSIVKLGFHWDANRWDSSLVACAGSKGCVKAASDTQSDGLALASNLRQRLQLDQPINIHISGCEKSCAQHHQSDIALVGSQEMRNIYDLYVGSGESSFGRQILASVKAGEIAGLIEQLLKIYQEKRRHNESFQKFINRQNLTQLQHWLNYGSPVSRDLR